ncbi:hypothetical protein M413DRAFT_367482 [Hebeloma cylindrosporum]|uniref:Uncharacterized protein n=1 Tax=Hebeloma cylindrosporum TaxID=76867 RepID=A0A0C2Y510_HEBCY|nr:hypothetical protein M413DRAFT_367482 [Hebeloma cylindrosporum h7]
MSTLLPKSGTLHCYPASQLVTLVRLILTQYESHLQVEYAASLEADEGEATTDAGLILEDIQEMYYFVDLPRSEELRRGEKIRASEYRGIDDPKQPERALLNIGIYCRANYLFVDAVKFRKETRGQPSNGGNWDDDHEDALLNFLVFLSHPEHKDLFTVGA